MREEKRYITNDDREFSSERAAILHELEIAMKRRCNNLAAAEFIKHIDYYRDELLAYLKHKSWETQDRYKHWGKVRKVDGKEKNDPT